jgi:hypothetical protein
MRESGMSGADATGDQCALSRLRVGGASAPAAVRRGTSAGERSQPDQQDRRGIPVADVRGGDRDGQEQAEGVGQLLARQPVAVSPGVDRRG